MAIGKAMENRSSFCNFFAIVGKCKRDFAEIIFLTA
jgi:hypothetical protein